MVDGARVRDGVGVGIHSAPIGAGADFKKSEPLNKWLRWRQNRAMLRDPLTARRVITKTLRKTDAAAFNTATSTSSRTENGDSLTSCWGSSGYEETSRSVTQNSAEQALSHVCCL
jgi:hypothetical protein